jgi:hypothetical protein
MQGEITWQLFICIYLYLNMFLANYETLVNIHMIKAFIYTIIQQFVYIRYEISKNVDITIDPYQTFLFYRF